MVMTQEEKAKMILKELEEYIQVDFSFEEIYLKAISKGLDNIAREEKLRK